MNELPTTVTAQPPTVSETPSAAPAPLASFGDFEILEELGHGGMGVVYKARQKSLDRPVALKVVRAAAGASEQELARFRIEATSAARLDHSNIVPVYQVGEHAGVPFLVMKLVEGTSLAADLPHFRRQPRAAAHLLARVARAVQHAHERGVLHRDLKPGNVLLDRRKQPLVADFGLAKLLDSDEGRTRTGTVMGTPSYMAPEQAEGRKDVGPAADVYSLGAILYAMLTGVPPFRGKTAMETVRMVLDRDPVPPRRLNPDAPRDLETVCLKCLSKDPRDRYASAQELAEDLERFVEGLPIHARPVGRLERLVKAIRRRPVRAALVAALFLTAGIWLGLYWWKSSERIEALARMKAVQEKQDEEARLAADKALGRAEVVLRPNPVLAERLLNDPEAIRPDLRGPTWETLLACARVAPLSMNANAFGNEVLFSPDGRFLAVVDMSTGIGTVLDSADARICFTTPARKPGKTEFDWVTYAFSPDGKRFGLHRQGEDVLHEWDTAGGAAREVPLPGVVTYDGLRGYLRDGRWPAQPRPGVVEQPVRSPDGKTVARVTPPVQFQLHFGMPNGLPPKLADADGGNERDLAGPGVPLCVIFSPDSRRLAGVVQPAGIDGFQKPKSVAVWDAATGARLATWEEPDAFRLMTPTPTGLDAGNTFLAFGPDSRTVAWAFPSAATADGATLRVAAVEGPGGPRTFQVALRDLPEPGRNEPAPMPGGPFPVHGPPGQAGQIEQFPGGFNLGQPGQIGQIGQLGVGLQVGQIGAVGQLGQLGAVGQLGQLGAGGQFGQLGQLGALGNLEPIGQFGQQLGQLGALGQLGQLGGLQFGQLGQLGAGGQFGGQLGLTGGGVGGGQMLGRIGGAGIASSALTFSPDGRTLATVSRDGGVRLWDAATGQRRTGFQYEKKPLAGVHRQPVVGLAFAPRGKRAVSGSLDGEVKVWDVGSWTNRLTLHLPAGRLKGVGISGDGSTVAAVGLTRDGTACDVRVWDAATGRERFQHRCRPEDAGLGVLYAGVALSADGQRVAIAINHKTVAVWDTVAGRELAKLPAGVLGDGDLAFSPDGGTLVAAENQGWNARLWGVQPDRARANDAIKVIEIASQRVRTLPAPAPGRMRVAFSPEGRWLVVAVGEGGEPDPKRTEDRRPQAAVELHEWQWPLQ